MQNQPAYTILRLKEKDACDLAALEKDCFSTGWSPNQYSALLRAQDASSQICWLGFGLRGPCGALEAYIVMTVDNAGRSMEIVNIAVRACSRRLGFGRTLLDHALNWGKHNGIESCMLDVREHNLAAIGLYEKAGFRLLSRRKKYYADTSEDALVLVCDLHPYSSCDMKE